MQRRVRFFGIAILLCFVALLVRLFSWQVMRAKELSAAARSQYESGRTLTAPRGNILAADGSFLAGRGEAWRVFASLPDVIAPSKQIAEKLAPLFLPNSDRGELLTEIDRIQTLLDKQNLVWVPLKNQVDNDTKKNIEALKIAGIGFEPQEIRIYPEASAAAHLLGFVGKNSEGEAIGYFGLEGFYDQSLSGKPGFVKRESDAAGSPILLGDSKEVTAISGVDLVTHIDKNIQLVLEKKLLEGIERYGAKGGTAIVMNPATGAIVGMNSYPAYEPAKYPIYSNELFKNPAVSDAFEPGSVFKILVMAAGLDAGVVEPDTKCDICGGPMKVDKYEIETWNKKYNPDSTMVDVIVHSDNVGMSFVAQKLGVERMYDYLEKFGIGKLTGIDLQGEVTPALREKSKWSIVDLVTASFGQGIAVTPVQMLRAAGAIANGGVMVSPQVVDKLQGAGWKEDIKPASGVRVISAQAASEITAMMVEAAKNGESKWTYERGFRVAGKTGTAQIPIAGHYDAEKTIASFVGFAPAEAPKFIMLVTLKEPQTSTWASETAAPLWYSIAKDLFFYFGIQPER